MAAAVSARLLARERLRSPADFRRVFRQGQRVDGRLFLLIAAENTLGFSRIGLAASRKLGGAVERNRAKRLLREVFRRDKPAAWDMVFVAKPALVSAALIEVESEYRERLQRLARRRRDKRPGEAAPPAR
jgi:ribonuclease P protein component